ncbi:MAG: hypothetical protein U1G07_02920 [Verrucomicrobiota bacterium]
MRPAHSPEVWGRPRLGDVELTVIRVEADAPAGPPPLPPGVGEAGDKSRCRHHPDAEGSWVCTRCGRTLCGACVRLLRIPGQGTTAICRSCQGLCQRPRAPGASAVPRSFGVGLLESFSYPLRGDAPFMLVGATLLYAVLNLLQRVPAAGLALWLIGAAVGAYMLTFFRQVVLSSAHGEASVPSWPDLDKETILETLFQFLAVYLVSFGPAFLLMMFGRSGGSASPMLTWGLFSIGAVYFPMALLSVLIFDSIAGVNPAIVLLSIAKCPGRYLALLGVLAAALGLVALFEAGLGLVRVPLLTSPFTTLFGLYGTTAGCRALGWFYHSSQEKLGWC